MKGTIIYTSVLTFLLVGIHCNMVAMIQDSSSHMNTLATFQNQGDSFKPKKKTIPANPGLMDTSYNRLSKKQINTRVKIISGVNLLGYGASLAALYGAWYKNYPQSEMHSFNDIGEWKGMDKIGHAYAVYAESLLSMELWRYTGISRKKWIWIGGLSGPVYHTVIEILDGYSAEWGWSWGDVGANFLGSGMLIAQQLAWNEQRIQFKFSVHRKTYNDPSLNLRSNEIYGSGLAERFLKDYNGQTYWLSTNVKSFFPKSRFPAWLNIALGTGADGLFGAHDNIGKDKNGNIVFNRTDIKRYRQWYLGPDIDFSKIKTNKKVLKLAFRLMNIIKFPMPAIEYSNGSFKFRAIAF